MRRRGVSVVGVVALSEVGAREAGGAKGTIWRRGAVR